MTTYIPKKVRSNSSLWKSIVLYLLITLLSLLLMGSFVSDNVYLSASKVTSDPAGVEAEYRAAIGDGLYQEMSGAAGVQ